TGICVDARAALGIPVRVPRDDHVDRSRGPPRTIRGQPRLNVLGPAPRYRQRPQARALAMTVKALVRRRDMVLGTHRVAVWSTAEPVRASAGRLDRAATVSR